MSNIYLGLVFIFPTMFHPDPSTLIVFQVLGFPLPTPRPHHQIRSGFKIRALRQDILLNIKFHSDPITVRKLKIPHFSNF